MSASKYSLNWNSYEHNVCNGLAKLQQNEEFVDMSLVADGHLVKVHKSLLALASPYIKQIIQATPCKHPIIFFNNISHQILCYILEYIYTGQVQVEVENLQSFLTAAKDLHLPSIANFLPSTTKDIVNAEPKQDSIVAPVEESGPIQEHCINISEADIPVSLDNYGCIDDTTDINDISDLIQLNTIPNPVDYESAIDTDIVTQNNDGDEIQNPVELKIDMPATLPHQYTFSNRGSLQLILNRYIYSNHHQSLQGRKRRWRCIDYRLLHCQAYIDTLDDTITKRKNVHIHPFHDKKIMKKIKASLIFESIGTATNRAKKLNNINNITLNMEESD